MSNRTHSQDSASEFEWDIEECKRAFYDAAEAYDKIMEQQEPQYQFDLVLEPEKQTTIQKIKRWISKRKPPLNTILMHLFSYVEMWYWEGKVKQTMSDVDRQIEDIHELWDNEHSIRIRVEEEPSGVAGLPTLSIRSTFTESGTEESESGVEASSIKIQIPDPWDENA